LTELLEPLVSIIETIKDRIDRHGASLRQNETRTRAALIDPLLQALGWDTTDPALVTPEYRTGGWADYALIGPGNRPVAIIEAKRLGSVVENHLEQAVGYCIQQGIAYAGVTDGNHWQLYRTFEPVPLVEKLVLDVTIADATSHEIALQMLLVWRRNIEAGQPVAASLPMDITSPNFDVDLEMSATDSTLSSASSNSATPLPRDWTPLSRIDDVTGRKAPVAIRFSDGTTWPVRAWWRLLFETAESLVRNGQLTVQNCPGSSGRDWHFINSVPRTSNGRNLRIPQKLSNGIYVEAHLGSKQIVIYSKRLLAHFGVSAETVELRFE